MHRVVEKMGATAVDDDDELLLVFWRLAGGAVAALVVPVVFSVPLVDIFERGGLVVVLISGLIFFLKPGYGYTGTGRMNWGRTKVLGSH